MALGIRSHRPLITGTTHMIGAGHYLATAAGYRILEQGGNAADAGVAAGLTLNVVLPQYTSLGGVAPIIVHDAARQETITVSGLGRWPKTASIDYFNQHHSGDLPAGVPRTVTPAAADAWLTTLKLYGTMTFEQVVTPALELAEGGFPIPHSLHRALSRAGDRLAHDEGETMRWARDARQFYPNGKALQPGDLLVQPDLARTLRRLIEAERGSAGQGREAAIQAARDRFYRGDIAQEMVRFNQGQGGLLTMEDLAEFHVGLEPPAVGSFRGVTVYTCDTWTQGPTSIQALQILEQFDLKAMGHNSADYLHTLLEALKLAFADRHAYYGDPKFVDVPLAGLLDRGYAAMRSQSIDPRRASPGMPEAGDPWPYQGQVRPPRRQARPEPLRNVRRREGADGRISDARFPFDVSSRPERAELDRHFFEGWSADRRLAKVGVHEDEAIALTTEHFESFQRGVDEPHELDARGSIDRQLLFTIDSSRRRREHLAKPVGRTLEPANPWQLGKPLSPPAGDVGNQNIVVQMNFRLEENPPSTGPAPPSLESVVKIRRKRGRSIGMARRRSWRQIEIAFQKLRDFVARRRDHVLVRRTLLGRLRHGPRLPRKSRGRQAR